MKADERDEVEIVAEVRDLSDIHESRMIAVCCPSGFSADNPPMGPVPLLALLVFGYEPEDMPECQKLLDAGFMFVTCLNCSVEAQTGGWPGLPYPVPLPPNVIEHLEEKREMEQLMAVWTPDGLPC